MSKEHLSIVLWTIYLLIKILSPCQGKTLMIDPYTVVVTFSKGHMLVGNFKLCKGPQVVVITLYKGRRWWLVVALCKCPYMVVEGSFITKYNNVVRTSLGVYKSALLRRNIQTLQERKSYIVTTFWQRNLVSRSATKMI